MEQQNVRDVWYGNQNLYLMVTSAHLLNSHNEDLIQLTPKYKVYNSRKISLRSLWSKYPVTFPVFVLMLAVLILSVSL